MKTFRDDKEDERCRTRRSPHRIAAGRHGGSAPPPGSPAAVLASKPGLRMRPQRPMRALAGALVVVASVVAALAIYARIGNRTEVLAVSRDVLAGEQISDADLQVVSISSRRRHSRPCRRRNAPRSSASTPGSACSPASLLAADSVQARPIVDPERVLMSVVVPVGLVPGRPARAVPRRPRRHAADSAGGDRPAPVLVEAVVAAVPRNLGEVVGSADAGQGVVALAVEVPPEYVGVVGEARGGERRRARRGGAVPERADRRPRLLAIPHAAPAAPSTTAAVAAAGAAEPRRPDDAPDDRDDDDGRTTGMTIVAVCCGRRVTSASTTTALSPRRRCCRRATRRCSPSAIRPAATSPAWAQLPIVAGMVDGRVGERPIVVGDRRQRPAAAVGARACMVAPARAAQAHTAVGEAARDFAGLLAAMPDVVTVADCGRVDLDAPLWATSAQLTLLLVRQSRRPRRRRRCHVSTGRSKRSACCAVPCRQVGVVLIGGAPYRSSEIAVGARCRAVRRASRGRRRRRPRRRRMDRRRACGAQPARPAAATSAQRVDRGDLRPRSPARSALGDRAAPAAEAVS